MSDNDYVRQQIAEHIQDEVPAPPTRTMEHGERPVIHTNGRYMREITADAIEALERANDNTKWLFVRGGAIARLDIEDGTLRAVVLGQDALRGVLDRVADFVSVKEAAETPARPPLDVVKDLMAQPSYPLPQLRMLAEAPLFLPDGSLLANDGYDVTSGVYLHLDGLASGLHVGMPKDEAVRLLTKELLGDFPFSDDGSKAHAVSLVLLPFLRTLIKGPTPLYLIDAPARGTGKGLLAEVTGMVSLGRSPSVNALPHNDDEFEKRVTSMLLGGAQHILLDNVRVLKSQTLEAALTSTVWEGRRLGKSYMVHVPNDAVWLATGNNVAISDEMARRIVPIRLDAQMERPEERAGWRHPNLPQWTMQHRPELVSACISIIHAWIQAGATRSTSPTLGRFEEWAAVMGGVLGFMGISGFLGNRERLYTDSDSETEEWKAACQLWWESFEGLAITAGDLLDKLKSKNLLLDIWGGRGALAGQQRLGRALGERRDRVFGEVCIKGAGRDGATRSQSFMLIRKTSNESNPRNHGNPREHGDQAAPRSGFHLQNPDDDGVSYTKPRSGEQAVVPQAVDSGVSGVLNGPQSSDGRRVVRL